MPNSLTYDDNNIFSFYDFHPILGYWNNYKIISHMSRKIMLLLVTTG